MNEERANRQHIINELYAELYKTWVCIQKVGCSVQQEHPNEPIIPLLHPVLSPLSFRLEVLFAEWSAQQNALRELKE